jgi:hypothetical protein
MKRFAVCTSVELTGSHCSRTFSFPKIYRDTRPHPVFFFMFRMDGKLLAADTSDSTWREPPCHFPYSTVTQVAFYAGL